MKANPHGPVDIVLVTWHRQEITERTIKAIYQNTKRENYNLIVIDNGSPHEMVEMLKGYLYSEIIDNLILNEENRGLEPARNQGLNDVESVPYFICADSDCLPQKIDKDGFDWIDHLVYLMDINQLYGAISCRTQVMVGTGDIFSEHEDQEIVEFPHPGGSLRIMLTPVVKELGGWRNEVNGRGTEERYICGQLHERGLKTGFAVKVKTFHQFGPAESDRWGYPQDWAPEQTGHSDIWHPAFNGDDPTEVAKYVKE